MHSEDHRQWESMMGDDAMNELLLSGEHPWLNRAVENPARLESEFTGEDGYTYTTESSILTEVSRHPDTNVVIIYPTIRMIDGELKSLDSRKARDIAVKKGDYIQVGGDEEFGTEVSKGISAWLDREGRK